MTDLKDNHSNLTENYNIADLLRAYQIIDDGIVEDEETTKNKPALEDSLTETTGSENTETVINQVFTPVDTLETLIVSSETEDDLLDTTPTFIEAPWSLWGVDRKQTTEDKLADFWSPWLLILVGILGGSILTLLILQGINGTLAFNDTTAIDRLQNQIIELNHQVHVQGEAVDPNLNRLNNQLSSLEQSHVSETEATVQQLQTTLNTIELRASELATQVVVLEKTMTDLVTANEGTSVKTSKVNSDIHLLQNEINTIQTKLNTLNLSNKTINTTLQNLQDDVDQYNTLFITLREFLLALEEPANIVDSEN